jgi:DNA modification methylase
MRDVVLYGDCLAKLKELPDSCVQTCVTSPPYWNMRTYLPESHEAKANEIGNEATPEEYVAKLVEIFHEVHRVLRDGGTLWVNLGDCYTGSMGGSFKSGAAWDRYLERSKRKGYMPGVRARTPYQRARMSVGELKPKNLIGIPWMTAFALRTDQWILRCDVIWEKPNVLPEPVQDRPTRSHEYMFLFSKGPTYYYDYDAVLEPFSDNTPEFARGDRKGRNKRSVWRIQPRPYLGAHFAVFPPELPTLCIKAGSKPGDVILDPFAGSGTTLMVAKDLDRDFIGIELNEAYRSLIEERVEPARKRAVERALIQAVMDGTV